MVKNWLINNCGFVVHATHRQMVRQRERINSLKYSCGAFVQSYLIKWSKWLSLSEFWYNTYTHASLNKSPFKVLYRLLCPNALLLLFGPFEIVQQINPVAYKLKLRDCSTMIPYLPIGPQGSPDDLVKLGHAKRCPEPNMKYLGSKWARCTSKCLCCWAVECNY